MKKALTFVIFAILFFVVVGTASASSSFTQTISLNAGWNIVSTPRVLDNYGFSAAETVNNFDIYVLNPSDPSGWSTMAGMGQAEFQPLYGYFVNNKTGVNQTLTLNYKQEVEPNERLFERNFTQTGWYSIGSANPTYVKSKCSDTSDVNNVGNILNSLDNKFSSVIDFTDGSFITDPNSAKIDAQWKSVTPSDVNSLNDLRELKGYGIYINQGSALYDGFQNTDGVCASLTSIAITTPATKLSYTVGDTLDITGLVVTGTYSDGSAQIETVTVANVAGFNSTTPVTGQVLTITVNGRTTTYTVDIVAAPIIAGSLSISVSTASPSGSLANVVRSITPQILGVYDIRAVGEDILINTVNLQLADATGAALGQINNVGLYNEAGALLSDQITWTNAMLVGLVTQTFTMNWQISADTTEKLYIKGTTNTLTGGTADVVFAQLALVGGSSIVGTGMSSASQAGPNNIVSTSTLALPALTINPAATAIAIADTSVTPRNQALLGPSAQVVVGSIKVTAQGESQDYYALELTGVPSSGNLTTMFSGVALFDGATAVTNWVAPVGNLVTFTNAQTITPVTFVFNTPKTLSIVANVLTPATQGRTVRWTTAAAAGTAATLECLQTIGKTSGTIAETGGGDFRANSGNLGANTGGILTLYSDVLAIAETVGSPSGTIARSNNAKLAEWELNAYGTGANLQIDEIVFTSKTGGLAGAGIVVGDFTLYDETNGIALAAAADALNAPSASTITFNNTGAGNILTVTSGVPLVLSLKVDTTSLIKFPQGTQLHWTINRASDIHLVETTGGAFRAAGIPNGVTTSIPADASIVTLP